MNKQYEPNQIISLIQRNADFGEKKKSVFNLIDQIESKALNENNGFSIGVVDDLLARIRVKVDSVSASHSHILESITLRLEEILSNKDYYDIEDYLTAKLIALDEFLKVYNDLIQVQNEYLNESLDIVTQKIELEIKKIRELRNRLQNADSENIYDSAKNNFNNTKHSYLGLFFFTVIATLSFAVASLVFKKNFFDRFEIEAYDYWVFKITVLSLCVTILSFFLKQVVHYQKKEDFAEKISLELNAFPSYISDLDPEDGVKLRKELALKYFGNDQNKGNIEASNLNVEQMKVNAELIKISTEVIKNLSSKKN
ncbi:hypothetical protein [Acinetobacter colistiniresistens]|uniref:hypothetical protein n=1 Tax=Acinetobacter colistiniresistens TaxID=280145 RepID=UPI002FE0C749